MRVLIDSDVILDHLLPRPPFLDAANIIWTANARGQFEGYISAITPVNVFYIARKARGIDVAQQIVAELLQDWHVCAVNKSVLNAAQQLNWTDFEDAVQQVSAIEQGVDVMVTRNLRDYRQASLTVLSPTEFITRLSPPTS
jgi:predicted nucleic acid-binding protein